MFRKFVATTWMLALAAGGGAAADSKPPPPGFHEVIIGTLRLTYLAADQGVGCEALPAASKWSCVDDAMGDWAIEGESEVGPSAYTRLLVRLVQLREAFRGRPVREVMTAYGGAGLVCEALTPRGSNANAHLATCRYVPAEPVGGQTVFIKLIGDAQSASVGRMEFRRVSGSSDSNVPGSPRPIIQHDVAPIGRRF